MYYITVLGFDLISNHSGIYICDENLLPNIGFKPVRSISSGKPKTKRLTFILE